MFAHRSLLPAVAALALIALPGRAAAQTSPVIEFLGQRFCVTLGGMPGSQCVAFDPVNDRVITAVEENDLCGATLMAGIPHNGAAWDPVTEDYWYITANNEVFAYNQNNPVLQFQIPQTFTVPGAGPDTLENPQGFAMDLQHVYVLDAGPNLGELDSNAWFKFTRTGTPVASSKTTGLTAALQSHFDAFGDAVLDGMTWIPDDAPYGAGLFLLAVEHTGFLVLDEDGNAVDELIWQDEGIPMGEATPFAFAGIAIDPGTGDLYLVENAGASMHVWLRLDPTVDQTLVYNVYGNYVIWPDTRCLRRTILPTQSNQFSLTYRDADGLLWTNEFNSGDIITIDPRSGKQTSHGPCGVQDIWGMAYDTERDVIYMYETGSPAESTRIHVLDPTTLATTPLPSPCGHLGDMAFNPDDGFIYGVRNSGGPAMLMRVDRDTGAATEVGPTVAAALAYDRVTGTLLGLGGSPRRLWDIDPATGTGNTRYTVPAGVTFEGLAAIHVPAAVPSAVALPSAPPTLAVRAVPNPSRGPSRLEFSLRAPGRVNARVVDVTGRVVRTLARDRTFGTGPQSLAWDGRTEDGRRAQAGVYFVDVRRDAERGTARMVIVR